MTRGNGRRERRRRARFVNPTEPEHREEPRSPAPDMSNEEAALQLASDPEYREWQGAEWSAELAAKTRAAHR